jgi:hypothetical protein
MARDFFINGPTMVSVKGRTDSAIANTSELGLSDAPIRVVPNYRFLPIHVDAWGQAPADVQMMLATVDITISLVHFDRTILAECLRLSMGGAAVEGALPMAGQRLGNNLPRFHPGGTAGNNYIGLNLSSPAGSSPWRFYFAYMTGPPVNFPLGAERSVVVTTWTVVPYTRDPYGAGSSSLNYILWDHGAD